MTKGAGTAPAMSGQDWGLLLVLSALWGGSFLFFKILVAGLPPLTIVFGRVFIAASLLNLILLLRRDPMPRDRETWRAFLLMGLFNNVIPFGLLVFGETRIGSGLASILNATTPMFTVVVARLFITGERATANRLAGVLIGILGVAVLAGPDLVGAGRGDLLGEAACLLAAVSYGVAAVFGRRFRVIAPLKVATGQLSASALMAFPLCLVVDRPWTLPLPGIGIWAALLGLAIPCTAIAYLIFFRILQSAGSTNVSLVTLLVPVSAVTLGGFALGEVLTPEGIGGMALIGSGLVCIDGRVLRWRRGAISA